MSTTDPLTLRLPGWLCESFDLARAIANEHRSLGRMTGVCRYDRFDMRSHERAFVKTVLARRSNLWLFRTNQRRSCGDFIAIDMSSSRRADRRAFVMELKTGDRLVIGEVARVVGSANMDLAMVCKQLHFDGLPPVMSTLVGRMDIEKGPMPHCNYCGYLVDSSQPLLTDPTEPTQSPSGTSVRGLELVEVRNR